MKQLILVWILLVLWNTSFAQQTEVRPYPMEEKALLWQITGPNIVGDVYLFGTMHLIEKDYFLFTKKMEKLVKKSDLLVMELPGMPNQAEASKYIMLKEGSLFDFFTPEQTDTILHWAKEKLNFEETVFRGAFAKLKPFALVQLAVQIHFMGKTESYELTFEKLAKENNIPIKGLETVAEQMAIFDNLSDEQQVQMVMESIREGDKPIEMLKNMQNVYAAQNIDALYTMIVEEGGVIAQETNEFLDNRNTKWVPKIIKIASEGNAFIAVGAGHLGGPKGVIRQLESNGYTLTPVKL